MELRWALWASAPLTQSERLLVPRREAERERHHARALLTLFDVAQRRAFAGVIKTQDRPAIERDGVARGAG